MPTTTRSHALRTTIATLAAAATLSVPFTARAALTSTASLAADGTLLTSTRRASQFASVSEAATFIQTNCKTVLQAARTTGRCLYRGERLENLDQGKSWLLAAPSDLLSPDTYSPAAADFFQYLDREIGKDVVKKGHIAVANVIKASEWGPAHSIWPVDGEDLHTLWLSKNKLLWEPEYALPQGRGKLGAFFWRDPGRLKEFLKDNAVIDGDLEAALSGEFEVIFASGTSDDNKKFYSPYVAVPVFLEGKLLDLLDVKPFSSSVRPAKAQAMEVDDVRRSKRDRFVVY